MSHRPPHLLINKTWYFISAHTAGKIPLISTDQHKLIWLSVFKSIQEKFKVNPAAWVLLDNHYHFLSYFKEAKTIPKFIKQLHGATSYKLNRFDHKQSREVWYSYWDRCIRDQGDYWTKFNYIHYNPVKHGYVNHPEDWRFSSYPDLLRYKGIEWADDCWTNYPVVEFNFEE